MNDATAPRAVRILHLEDSAMDGELVREYLRTDGLDCSLYRVWDREGFTDAVKGGGFDLIIADHRLPDFDGEAALDIAHAMAPHIPFIFVSGTLGEEIAVEALKRGATDYVVKQRLERLPAAVRRALAEAAERDSRRKAEEALKASEANFSTLVHAMPLLCWMTDGAGNATWYNERWHEYTGTTPDEMVRRGAAPFIDPALQDEVFATWARAVKTGKPFEIVVRLLGADGVYRPFLTRALPVHDASGRVTGWLGTNTDISAQREAEAALVLLNQTLEQQVAERTEERDRMWRLSRDLLVVIDRRWRVLAVNPALTTLLGHEGRAIEGRRFDAYLHPEDLALARRNIRRAAIRPVGDFEARVRAADGGWRWFSWSAAPGSGEAYVIGRDVTAEKERRRELEGAREALLQSQKMESLGQLTGGVAHDFNNLLTAVVGGLDLILRRNPDERTRRLATGALKAAERGTRLTGQLLAFSRTQRLELRPTPAGPLIEQMRELLARTLGPAIALDMALEAGSLTVMADPTQLELAVLNLALNARDAMPQGGRLSIAVRPAAVARDPRLPDGDYIGISVEDTGTGMPPSVAARVFEPFFTTKPVGKGTGLGLSMVYGVAKQSGGDVRIDSRIGEGTTITMLLPRTAAAQEGNVIELTREAGAGDTPVSILLVDDDPDVRHSVAEILTTLGHAVQEAADGPSALRLLAHSAPDLLLLDFAMPGMNGAEIAAEARRIRPGQRILFITGYAESAALERLAGDAAVLRKPFRAAELGAAVQAALVEPASPAAGRARGSLLKLTY